MVDYTNELIEFCDKYKINLIRKYENVKNTTPIYFNCFTCNIQVKKSYKTLTKNKDCENVAVWSNMCHKCFRNSMH